MFRIAQPRVISLCLFVFVGNLAMSAVQLCAAEPPASQAAIGWRGDGTGRYPNATPVTEWYQKKTGESKNILWKAKLPCYTWSTPIVVGDKIFTLSDPFDLICLDKTSGKLLWIRSFPPVVGATDVERTASPALKEIDPLLKDLQKVNDELVAKGWTADIFKRKRELQLKIDDLSTKANKKFALPPDQYVESWTGYTAPTPCSDGKFVYVTGGDGVTACFDLEGNRKWAVYESLSGIWGEHGYPNSPAVVGDILLAPSIQLRALNKATGAEIYHQKFGSSYSIATFKSGDTDFAIASGNYFRVKDGKVLVERRGDMPGGQVAVIGDMVYFGGGHVSFYRWQSKGTDDLSITPLITDEYNRFPLPGGDSPKLRVDPTITGFKTASPLYHDGLLYCLANFGKLTVVDTQKTKLKDAIVYSEFPAFELRNGYSRKTTGMGIGASPALGGKYIYMIDSANCTVVIEPGRTYKQVAVNFIEETVPDQLSNKAGAGQYWSGPHQEQTEASPIFDGSHIYIRGEQFLYCIGQK